LFFNFDVVFSSFPFAPNIDKLLGDCDGAVAGGRLELRPPVESSDLDEKVLTTTPVRDTSSLVILVES
jgi:hypothetical protein